MMTLALVAESASSGFSAEAVGQIIAAVVVGLLGGGVLGKKISDKSRVIVGPQPLEVALREKFVSHSEFAAFEGDMKNSVLRIETRIESSREADRGTARTSASVLHNRIDDTQKLLANVSGKLDGMNDTLKLILTNLVNSKTK